MGGWPNRTIQGVTYTFDHLSPFTMEVTPKAEGAKTYSLLVDFHLHTFAREWRHTDTPDYRFAEGKDIRCLCTERYGMSLSLPEMIRASTKAYFSQKHNYMVFRPVPDHAPYAAFFSMQRAKNQSYDAIMTVVSAYQKGELPKQSLLKSIGFATLVAKTARGEEIRRP
ncbi:hypothetical protein NKH94_30465 [Mesorhizobium australicum]|uniref:hypothetical protein n=1 Tax=Mesorhizobium australicum TaxID=536018 RepID=UPI003338B92B